MIESAQMKLFSHEDLVQLLFELSPEELEEFTYVFNSKIFS